MPSQLSIHVFGVMMMVYAFNILFFILRDREHERGKGRERGREGEFQTGSMQSVHQDQHGAQTQETMR